MDLTSANLRSLFAGFNAAFQVGFGAAPSYYEQVAMQTTSTTAGENYGWMKDLPGIREWVGERVVHSLETADYHIKNKPFELSVGVDRDKIDDDTYGLYGPMFNEIGRQSAEFPNLLVFGALKNGFATRCYDGQYYFDTDHPVIDAAGATVSVSNSQGGAGTPWYLADLSRSLKPMVYQRRRPFNFTRMDGPTDEVVFMRKEYRYGVDGRCNVGFGFWQLCYASRQPLTAANYEAARIAMGEMKRDHGTPLGIVPTHLIVPPSLEGAARKILEAEQIDGTTNQWRGTAKVMAVPYLA